MTEKFLSGLYAILEKQGLAVALVLVGVLWASGLMPFRLCEPQVAQQQIIESLQRQSVEDRRISAIDREATLKSMTEIAKAINRIDSRDAIRTCAQIPAGEARIACIEVAVRGR